jgi:hypothetical protein
MLAVSLRRVVRALAAAAAALVAIGVAGAALASPLQFTFSSTTGPSASFVLDSSPTPDVVSPFYFLMTNPIGTFDGGTNTAQYVGFHGQDGQAGGSFEYYFNNGGGFIDHNYGSDKLYGGTNAAPTFIPGTYSLFDSANPAATNTLTIAAPGAPGPEIGLGVLPAMAALGGLLLTRRRWGRAR